jgi:flagellar basal-body rod protein FlgB
LGEGNVPSNLFELISARQHWLSTRFGVLAQNVANADTPGFRPRDLAPGSFAEMLDRLRAPQPPEGLQRTHPRHLDAGPGVASEPRARPRTPLEVAPAGNAVVLAEELRKLGETQRNYLLDLNLMAKYRSLLRSALGIGR